MKKIIGILGVAILIFSISINLENGKEEGPNVASIIAFNTANANNSLPVSGCDYTGNVNNTCTASGGSLPFCVNEKTKNECLK